MSKLRIVLCAVLAPLLFASGCQSAGPPPEPTHSEPLATIRPTEVPSALPTATQPPPISTPPPTPTPTPMPLPTSEPPSTPVQLSVPALRGEAPVIDGTLDPGEWDGAAVQTFADGSELLLTHGNGFLFLAIRSTKPDMIAGNIFVEQDGRIRILHASAALGTAVYLQEAGAWQRTQDFSWRCRDTSQSESAQAARDAFLQEEDWVAANSRMGTPNELEFQIGFGGETLQMAANLIRTTAQHVKVPWPAGLDDDCTRPTPGGLPEHLSFSPSRWASVTILPGE